MMKDKRQPQKAVFCLIVVSVQYFVFVGRHLPDDSRCRCSFNDPASEYLGIFGFQAECQCRNHFEAVSLDDVAVSAACATANTLLVQNAAFEYCPDIRAYGSGEYAEQVDDLALREPYSVGCGTNRYLPVRNRYGLCSHNSIRLIKSSI